MKKKCYWKLEKHGVYKIDAYRSWRNMRSRCNNQVTPAYKYYGGHGTKVCERWDDFSKFYEDIGDRPKGMELDRIDNNKGYSPENCRWATISTQNINRRGFGSSKYVGVTLHKQSGKWSAFVMLVPGKKKKRLGLFHCEREAASAAEDGRLRLDFERFCAGG